jgi:outer membrane receptor protein involved in Fe transport
VIDTARALPWLLSEHELTPGLRARLGAGIQYQSPTLDHALEIVEETRLVPQRSATIEAGVERRIGAAWRATVSAYYRRDTDLLRFEDAEIRLENNRVVVPRRSNWQNALNGDARGVELKVERRSAGGLNGWLSYAWNKSELEDAADGTPERFAADYDQRHTMNAFLAYRRSGSTSVSARLRYGSNFPIRGYIGAGRAGYVLSEQRNGLRLPQYVRLDLRADRTLTFRSRRLTLFMEVINASNHENFRLSPAGVNLITRRVFEPTETTFPLLPIAGVLVEF